MNYIVLDLEWNQPGIRQDPVKEPIPFHAEIIEFGAVKLDGHFTVTDTFKAYVAPKFYPAMNGAVLRLTGIRRKDLAGAADFPAVYAAFRDWCGEDCGLLTWGPDDVPVLMDNLIMHGLDAAAVPPCYDLQKIFGREILRDGKQCSLEKAMELLELPADPSHDALNDARNTARICRRMEAEKYLQEYRTVYVQYEQDRRSGLREGKRYPSLAAALRNEEVITFRCPYCGERLTCGEWAGQKGSRTLSYVRCGEGDAFCVSLKHTRPARDRSVCVSRIICEMNGELRTLYREKLGAEQTAPVRYSAK